MTTTRPAPGGAHGTEARANVAARRSGISSWRSILAPTVLLAAAAAIHPHSLTGAIIFTVAGVIDAVGVAAIHAAVAISGRRVIRAADALDAATCEQWEVVL
jgi:hypothetical protein